MKPRSYLTILILIFSFIVSGKAQTVSYTYDSSGNRNSRTINLGGGLKSETVQNEELNSEENKIEPEQFFQENLREMTITIFPNPTTGKLLIRFDNNPESYNTSITVYDLNAKIISRTKSISMSSEIDLSEKPADNYLLIIKVGEVTSRWKIVKQ